MPHRITHTFDPLLCLVHPVKGRHHRADHRSPAALTTRTPTKCLLPVHSPVIRTWLLHGGEATA